MLLNGPSIFLVNAADLFKWVQHIPSGVADFFEWAQQCSLPTFSSGPSASIGDAADLLGWAHQCS
jgi:hypothetical protein